jgi:hypothetical protein
MEIEEKIQKALYNKAAGLAALTSLPVYWSNMIEKPPEGGAPYLQVTHFPNETGRLFLRGSDPSHFKGILQVLVAYPLDAGELPASALAGKVGAYFQADEMLWESGLKVQITRKPSVGSGVPTKVSWEVPVSVPYEAFA